MKNPNKKYKSKNYKNSKNFFNFISEFQNDY